MLRTRGLVLIAALCCTACHAWTPTLDVLPSHRLDLNSNKKIYITHVSLKGCESKEVAGQHNVHASFAHGYVPICVHMPGYAHTYAHTTRQQYIAHHMHTHSHSLCLRAYTNAEIKID